jgi:hypothetical protein
MPSCRLSAQRGALLFALLLCLLALWGALPPPTPCSTRASGTGVGAAAAPPRAWDVANAVRLTRGAWAARGGGGAPPPPIFFLTAARTANASLAAQREEQYATNIAGILELGYQVYVSVSFTGAPPAGTWALLDALVRASAPGQLRVHHCSEATAVSRRTSGPDELLCMQEAIEHLFAGCILPWAPFSPLQPPPPCCPDPAVHVVKMSGRYLLAKHHLLHAVMERGARTDAFVKWGPRWRESDAIDFPQAYTFAFAMRVRLAPRARDAPRPHPRPRPLPTSAAPASARAGGASAALARAHPRRTFPPPHADRHQFGVFLDCHMNWLTPAGDDGRNGEHPSVWRFSIELLTGRCITALQRHEAVAELGIVANVANAAHFEYF